MNDKKIYVQAAEQISMQQPLSLQWMEEPERYEEKFVGAINPAFKEYLPANEVRRMSNIMKRALVTGIKVLKDTGIEQPDAIITGTSYGCLTYTEKFLDALIENGEETLSPTYFMQSTHNTVSSALAIWTKTHGYNVTYSHGKSSFDHTVLDAWMQMKLGKISNALVGGHEETYASFSELLEKTEYVGMDGMVPCSDMAMSMMLNTEERPENLCELAGITLLHSPSTERLKMAIEKLLAEADMTMDGISAVMVGTNGNPVNDRRYDEVVAAVAPQKPLLHYKHIFGENFAASAMGMYTAAQCLKRGSAPAFLYEGDAVADSLKSILLLNLGEGQEESVVVLKRY